MRTKKIEISVTQAHDHLTKLQSQKAVLEAELTAVDPKLTALEDRIIDAVLAGDSKANDLRRSIGELQARKTDLQMTLVRLRNLIAQAELDLNDARLEAYATRYLGLAAEINREGHEAVKNLKKTLESFDRHEILLEEFNSLSSVMSRNGIHGLEHERLIQFRRANDALDVVLEEVAAGTFKIQDGKTILDLYEIPSRPNRINARKEEISREKIALANGEVKGAK